MAIKIQNTTVIDNDKNLENIISAEFKGTSAIKLPSGTTAERPGSPVNGMIRYNTDLNNFEVYRENQWSEVGLEIDKGDTVKSVYEETPFVDWPVLYEITNFDSEKTYTLSTTNGTVSRDGSIITYTANTAGTAGFVINSRSIVFQAVAGDFAPVGLILPYKDAELPLDGSWEEFDVDDTFIIGASATKAANTSLSSNFYSGSTVTNTNSHTGTSSTWIAEDVAFSPVGLNAHVHSHVVTGDLSPDPLNREYKLTQCVVSSPIPKGMYLLASQTLSNLSNVAGSDSSLVKVRNASQYTGASAGTNTRSPRYLFSTGPNHNHGTLNSEGTLDENLYQEAIFSRGGHAHARPTMANISDNTKKKILSAWTNANARFGCEANGIAMWPSDTPPTGWVLCDGTNGTPDMRDYYLIIGNPASHGTGSGNNTYNFPSETTGNGGAHTHLYAQAGGAASTLFSTGYHADTVPNHTHSFSSFTVTETLRYIALTFIKKI